MKSKIYHLLPIILAVFLPGFGLYASPNSIAKEQYFFIIWLSGSTFLYVLWYVLWYSWEFKLHYKKWWYLSLYILLSLAFWYALYINDNLFNWLAYIRFIVLSLLYLTIQFALKTQQNITKLLLEKEQIQTENYKVQLKSLQAKVDPHFLFNSLNTLRSMVRQSHANSEKFIVSLAQFYRQTLKHDDDSTIKLSEELEVLESYLFVMKSRSGASMQVEVEIEKSLLTFQVPTLALQIVVENCFKHNSMTSKSPLKIEIYDTEDFYIVVKNNLQPKIGKVDSTGYGLNLLQKRYELLNIPQGLIIQETEQQFIVKLKLI